DRLQAPVPSSFTLRLFGPLEACVAGDLLSRPRSRKEQWLLALLALRHPRPIERSRLAGTLWPESSEEQALAYLRLSLARLRKALGPEARRIVSLGRQTL